MPSNALHEIESRDGVLWELVAIPIHAEEIVFSRKAAIAFASIALEMGVVCEWDRLNKDGIPPHLCRMRSDDTYAYYERKVGEGDCNAARELFECRYSDVPLEIA